ncbi:MAG: hypothetical protein DI598_02960 [Pseudopedobacter saltans]|uniref:Uncharacterized protein n=1 Tax=Pseudopedobacter saltans TaxID=151895 RepID=A0A2W5FD50_9SPHI|nr:MAG: hypothetical protein DI598_02960 [Pseudopedobacter saltans]
MIKFKTIFIFSFCLFILSCKKNKNGVNQNVYGKWINIEDSSTIVTIDSSKKEICIDYRKSGAGFFKAKYILSGSEFKSKIVPNGLIPHFDNDGYLRFDKNASTKIEESIESIYVYRFKRL